MNLDSLVSQFRCELQDGTEVDLHQYSQQHCLDEPYEPRTLLFSAWKAPPEMISLDTPWSKPSWRTHSFDLKLYISQFDGHPTDFLEALREGRVECLLVAGRFHNSYFLFIETKGSFATRIGSGETQYFGTVATVAILPLKLDSMKGKTSVYDKTDGRHCQPTRTQSEQSSRQHTVSSTCCVPH
jgi:hypothetical protein